MLPRHCRALPGVELAQVGGDHVAPQAASDGAQLAVGLVAADDGAARVAAQGVGRAVQLVDELLQVAADGHRLKLAAHRAGLLQREDQLRLVVQTFVAHEEDAVGRRRAGIAVQGLAGAAFGRGIDFVVGDLDRHTGRAQQVARLAEVETDLRVPDRLRVQVEHYRRAVGGGQDGDLLLRLAQHLETGRGDAHLHGRLLQAQFLRRGAELRRIDRQPDRHRDAPVDHPHPPRAGDVGVAGDGRRRRDRFRLGCWLDPAERVVEARIDGAGAQLVLPRQDPLQCCRMRAQDCQDLKAQQRLGVEVIGVRQPVQQAGQFRFQRRPVSADQRGQFVPDAGNGAQQQVRVGVWHDSPPKRRPPEWMDTP